MTEFAMDDLRRIYIIVPNDSGEGTSNLSVAAMSDKQFRDWYVAKADLSGISVIVPYGRLGYESRLNMVNYLVNKGVKIYAAPKA